MTQPDNEEKKLTVVVQEGKRWKRTLEIEVPKEMVDEEFEAVYEKYKNLSKIPGFREGKAPMHLVKLRYQKEIEEEILESLVPKAYEDAIKENNLSPISLPLVKEIQFKEGTPLKFKAEIEIKPEVEIKNYTGLEVVKRVKQITDKDIEQSLDYLRGDFAELHPVQRKAKSNDRLIVDMTKHQDGKEDKLKNQELFLDPHNMIKEFQVALVNAEAGEKKEFEVDYPSTFHNKKLAGKKVRYQITIKEIKEKVLPEVNDNFAKTVGGYNTIAELKSKIREGLVKKAQRDGEAEAKNELTNQVIKRNPFEVPETLLNFYMDSLIQDLKRKYQKVDEEKTKEKYRDIAIGHIRWDLLFHQIAEKENIQVTKEDMETWLEDFARDYKMKAEEARKLLENPSQIKKIKEDLLEKKVLEFLLKNAKIKEETFLTQETEEKKSDDQIK